MRRLALAFVCASLSAGPAVGGQPAKAPQPAKPMVHHDGAPRLIGTYSQWILARRDEGDATACFVFTRAEASAQHIQGRGDVVLSVTRRARRHDVVAVSAGFTLSGHEDAVLQAGTTRMLFYIAGRSAFARDNAAAIATFGHEGSVAGKFAGPRGITAADRFSLKGFSSAYAALDKSCPPG